MLLRLVACCVIASLFLPRTGQAWTRAHVREAHARVELAQQGPASVQLELVVDVQGGWLERLELPLLDEDLQLDEQAPAQVTLESGEQLPGRASARAGVVTLKFERRDGLRRGLHRVQVRYTTDLLARATQLGAGSRVSWTLPGWESGLLAADIVFVGNEPIKAVEDAELAQDVTLAVEGDQQLVRFARVHVPRASQWQVAVQLPPGVQHARRQPSDAKHEQRSLGSGLAAAAFCLAVTLWGRGYVRRRLARQRLAARSPWSRRGLNGWLLCAVATISALCWPLSQLASFVGLLLLPLLALEVSGGPLAPLAMGGFQPLARGGQAASRWARLRELLGVPAADLTTLAGFVSALALVVLLVSRADAFAPTNPWGLLVLTSLLGMAVSTRLRLPRSLAEQVTLLEHAARSTRTVSCALSLVWYVAGALRDQPRMRIIPRARYAGLLRLEVLVDSRRGSTPLVLSVLIETDSPCERWTRALWPAAIRERSAGGPRMALLLPVPDLSRAVEQLLEHYTRESQRAFSEPSEESQAA